MVIDKDKVIVRVCDNDIEIVIVRVKSKRYKV